MPAGWQSKARTVLLGIGLRRTRTDRLALYMRTRAAKQAARDEAVRIVDRWNAALAVGRGVLWSPTIRFAVLADMPWLDVHCPGCRTSRAIDIRTVDRHPASVGRKLCARAAVFVVSKPRTDACASPCFAITPITH
jgi:hypothetical protein